jgi:hypothetical protein
MNELRRAINDVSMANMELKQGPEIVQKMEIRRAHTAKNRKARRIVSLGCALAIK